MNVHEAITSRRTVHTFTDRPVSDDVLERALHAANHAPCHRKTYPWRFTLAGPRLRGELAGLAVHLKAETRPLQPADIEKIRAKILTPSILLVASRMQCPDPAVAREDYAACACAIQNFMLSLAEDGIGSKWMTGALGAAPEDVMAAVGAPAGEKLMGAIWYGYPAKDLAEDAKAPPRKKGLDGVLTACP